MTERKEEAVGNDKEKRNTTKFSVYQHSTASTGNRHESPP